MTPLFMLLAVTCADAPTVEVTTLNGESLSGVLESWSDDAVTVSGQQAVDRQSLHQIQFAEPQASIDDQSLAVSLASGSEIVATSVTRTGDKATMDSVTSGPMTVSTSRVIAVRMAPLEDRFRTTWTELLERERRDDLFVVVRGDALDHVACVLGEITDDTVSLRARGRNLTIPRSKVFGVLFASRPSNSPRVAGSVVTSDGSTFVASTLRWENDRLAVTTADGITQELAPEQLARVDLSAGRLVMFHEVEPRSVTYQPFGKNFVPDTEAIFHYRVNLNIADQPLRVGGRQRRHGVWMHSGTTATYTLPPRTKRLQATLGIDEYRGEFGQPVRVEFRVDGKTVFSEVIDPEQPRPIDIDLTDARQLTLVAATTNPDGHGIREHLAVVDARFIQD